MKGKVTVVGSGPSGVHFALTLLRRGYAVEMIDAGYIGSNAPVPDVSFSAMKGALADPVDYFLGGDFHSVVLPGSAGAYYGFPPSKDYVFTSPECATETQSIGFSPLSTYARGGFAEAWTAGSYTFNEGELVDFPFSYSELSPYYDEVASRIGISGASDDLDYHYPPVDGMLPALELDRHSRTILDQYERKRGLLNSKLRCRVGRSRVAALSRARGDRAECTYCGRCFWGCPNGALYTPTATLKECMSAAKFTYIPGYMATHFITDDNGRITGLAAAPTGGGEVRTFPVDTLALATGALSTSRIVLDSIYVRTGRIERLTGLMDNRQILVPFINTRMLGLRPKLESYQYNQLAMGISSDDPKDYIHVMLTTLKSALLHPVIQSLPFDLATSVRVFRYIHSALGLANVNLPDTRRAENFVTIEPAAGGGPSRLVINYVTGGDAESRRIESATTLVRKALGKLSCIAPKRMVHVRPLGSSVHYAGTIPMTGSDEPMTVDSECRSRDFENLYIVDGATFPFLPAKNYTLTLMANAIRVAERAF